MKKMSEMMEKLREAKAIMNGSYSKEQWEEKEIVDTCRANHYISTYADFIAHRDMEELDYDVDMEAEEIEEIERDLSFWWEEIMNRDFYEDLCYYVSKVNVAIN